MDFKFVVESALIVKDLHKLVLYIKISENYTKLLPLVVENSYAAVVCLVLVNLNDAISMDRDFLIAQSQTDFLIGL